MLIYKLAYAERFKDTSAGSILSAALFRTALDGDRVDEIDYGVGSDPYKRDWVEQRRSFRGVIAFNPRTVPGTAQFLRHVAGEIRRAVKALAAALRADQSAADRPRDAECKSRA